MKYEDIRQIFFEYVSGERDSLNDYKRKEISLKITKEDAEEGLMENTRYEWYDGKTKVAEVTLTKWPNNWISCHSLEVKPKYRGKGLSHDLVEFLKKKGMNHLNVEPNNKIAIHLYKKHGFKMSGTKEGKLLRMEIPSHKKEV